MWADRMTRGRVQQVGFSYDDNASQVFLLGSLAKRGGGARIEQVA